MRIFKLSLLSLLLVMPAGHSYAQRISISGSGKGYAGAEIKIYTLSDPVTKALIPLKKVSCDSAGYFSFETDATKEQTFVFKTGIFYLSLYSHGAGNIVLKLPDYVAKNEEEQQDSYFRETRMVPEVANDTTDINNLMRRFDKVYDPVFNRIADRIMYNTKKGDIPALIESLNSVSVQGNSSFMNDFIRFRLMMLNQVAGGEYPGRKEDSLLINSRFVPENPAYADLVEQMFTGYFRVLAGTRLKDSFNRALMASSAGDIEKVLNIDGKITNEQLAEYVIIMNLFNEYYGSMIRAERVIGLLKNLKQESSSAYIRELAGDVISRLTLLETGSDPPPLNLKDESGTWFSVRDHKGKFLLLSFAASDNAFSLSEFGLIRAWSSRFSGDLDVVTVLCDRSYEAGVKKLHNMGFRWKFLDGSSSEMDEYNYNVTMFPAFILLDRNGKIAVKQCPFPSENFDKYFANKLEEEKR